MRTSVTSTTREIAKFANTVKGILFFSQQESGPQKPRCKELHVKRRDPNEEERSLYTKLNIAKDKVTSLKKVFNVEKNMIAARKKDFLVLG